MLGPIDDSDEEDFDEEDELDEEKHALRKDRSSGSDEVLTMDTTTANNKTAEQDAKSSARRLHWPVIQVAVMDVIANAMVTVGFFYVGSGVSLSSMYPFFFSALLLEHKQNMDRKPVQFEFRFANLQCLYVPVFVVGTGLTQKNILLFFFLFY